MHRPCIDNVFAMFCSACSEVLQRLRSFFYVCSSSLQCFTAPGQRFHIFSDLLSKKHPSPSKEVAESPQRTSMPRLRCAARLSSPFREAAEPLQRSVLLRLRSVFTVFESLQRSSRAPSKKQPSPFKEAVEPLQRSRKPGVTGALRAEYSDRFLLNKNKHA